MRTPNPILAIDFYKADHRRQYPEGTTKVYSNFTPRSFRLYKGQSDKIVNFGLQMFIKSYLIDSWQEGFFKKPKAEVIAEYKLFMDSCLGQGAIPTDHIEELHDLGYLPLEIKALPEGALVPAKVPVLTITNTLPQFFWLVNYIETVMSTELWKPITNATIAYEYRKTFEQFADKTGANKDGIIFQGHDFSARGLSNREDGYKAGIAHLTSFCGTDTCLAIQGARDFYSGDYTKMLVGASVPATEHSVMSLNGPDNELDTFRRLITKLYPSGIVSIVSDTWDFWKVVTEYLPTLKQEIIDRKPNALGLAKVVIRPDSGDPVDIICGTYSRPSTSELSSPQEQGAIECLWDTFGGTINDKGYKVLNERIGLIYGDSITLERQQQILSKLEAKGFDSSNVVFGIGSYTYQYSTRDTFGFAMKATYGEVNGIGREIFKDPATDSGTKKSARGLLRVDKDKDGNYVLLDKQTPAEEKVGELKTTFKDGELVKETTLEEIRARLW